MRTKSFSSFKEGEIIYVLRGGEKTPKYRKLAPDKGLVVERLDTGEEVSLQYSAPGSGVFASLYNRELERAKENNRTQEFLNGMGAHYQREWKRLNSK